MLRSYRFETSLLSTAKAERRIVGGALIDGRAFFSDVAESWVHPSREEGKA